MEEGPGQKNNKYGFEKDDGLDTTRRGSRGTSEKYMHKHMCHKESTEVKYYMTAARSRVALERHQIIRCNLGLDNEEE